MTVKIGTCPECEGTQFALDPEDDRVLYGIFGPWMHEHNPGCSQYPETTEVTLSKP